MPSLGENNINIKIQTSADTGGVRDAERSIDGLSSSGGKLGGVFKGAVVAGAAAAATGIAATAAAAIKSVTAFADFEQSLNIFRSVSNATAEQMQEMTKLSKALGKDLTLPGVSAADAANAMSELAKAGLNVNQSMSASKGVLQLAKAGQLDTAMAAEIAANALLAFNMKGEEAVKVADMLAAAANASSASVGDIGISLQQASAVAAMTKRPIGDVVTQLALMANNGLKGSDAGTSVKSMLMALISPSETAAGAMREIGFSAYKSNGELKSTREVIGDLTKALDGKTDAQKNAYLADIFGSDGIRAIAIAMKGGVAEFDKMSAAIGTQGAAANLAAAQNAGLKGAMDNLRSIIETMSISLGEKLAPYVQQFATFLGNNLEPTARAVYARFREIWPEVERLAIMVRDFLWPSVAALVSTFQDRMLPTLVRLQPWFQFLAAVLGAVIVAAIWVLINALNVLISVWSYLGQVSANVGRWFVDRWHNITSVWSQAPSFFGRIGDAIAGVFSRIRGYIVGAFEGAYQAISGLPSRMANLFTNLGGQIRNIIGNIDIPGPLGKVKDTIPGFATGVRNFGGGLAVVGEEGPELVNLPKGSDVFTNGDSKRMLANGSGSGATTHYHYGNIYLGDASAVSEYFNQVDRDGLLMSKGLSPARGMN